MPRPVPVGMTSWAFRSESVASRSAIRQTQGVPQPDMSIDDGPETTASYVVVVNLEGQYSIWPAGREIPRGWDEAGKAGPREDCLAFIEEALDGHASAQPEEEDGARPG